MCETKILKMGAHYAVYVDDEFYCTSDTYEEAKKEVEMIKENFPLIASFLSKGTLLIDIY